MVYEVCVEVKFSEIKCVSRYLSKMSNIEKKAELPEVGEVNGSLSPDKTRSGWVKFEDESQETKVSLPPKEVSIQISTAAAVPGTSVEALPHVPAVLNTETVQVNLERGDRNLGSVTSPGTLSKNVEFVTVLRHGFC